jgi:ribose transport system substrate-binding protein
MYMDSTTFFVPLPVDSEHTVLRRIYMKKLLLLLLAACVVSTALWAGGRQEGADGDEQLRFAFVSPFIGHPYWVDVADGVDAAAKEFGISYTETGPIGEVNIDRQISAIETAIASKVDGILTMALNPEAFTPVINRAEAEGIPVVLIDTDAPESNRTVYAGTSNRDAGYAAGKAMAEATGGNAKIGIVTGAIDADNLNLRIDGFREAIKEHSGMTIVDIQPGNSDLLQATEKTQSMLQAHSDITALFGVSAEVAIAQGKIVEERGLKGKITIVGFDDLAETLDYIRAGTVYATTVQKPYMMGYLGIELLNRLNNGETLESDIIDTGVTIVTSDNVDSYN